MFPNVRLMIVAISASLLAIVCAMTLFMGMFAAFSVAHEPFSALAAGRPPLQIAFADELSAPVADGKPAPFGVRFRLNAPQVPNGPVIVAVPAALDRAPQDAPRCGGARRRASSGIRVGEAAETMRRNRRHPTRRPMTPGPTAKTGDTKTNEAKPDDANKDDVTAAVTCAGTTRGSPNAPRFCSRRNRIAPEIRIVAREAENPASVSTSPAPTLARKAIKRRKLAVRLHQLHHFRRPRIHPIAGQSDARLSGAEWVRPTERSVAAERAMALLSRTPMRSRAFSSRPRRSSPGRSNSVTRHETHAIPQASEPRASQLALCRPTLRCSSHKPSYIS